MWRVENGRASRDGWSALAPPCSPLSRSPHDSCPLWRCWGCPVFFFFGFPGEMTICWRHWTIVIRQECRKGLPKPTCKWLGRWPAPSHSHLAKCVGGWWFSLPGHNGFSIPDTPSTLLMFGKHELMDQGLIPYRTGWVHSQYDCPRVSKAVTE